MKENFEDFAVSFIRAIAATTQLTPFTVPN